MHNPKSVLENETYKILLDFEIQTDHLISLRPSDGQQKKKKKRKPTDFAVPADHKGKLK